jgi:hypothetical protein
MSKYSDLQKAIEAYGDERVAEAADWEQKEWKDALKPDNMRVWAWGRPDGISLDVYCAGLGQELFSIPMSTWAKEEAEHIIENADVGFGADLAKALRDAANVVDEAVAKAMKA